MAVKPDALRALQDAQKTAKARAQREAAQAPQHDPSDRDEAECFVHLVIAMYSLPLKVGMGVMPDGMAIYIRLSIPKTSTDERACMVSFVVSQDTKSVLNKAVDALEAGSQSQYWKVDRYAAERPG